MRYLSLIIFMLFALSTTAQVERYRQLPAELQEEVSRKDVRQARRAYQEAADSGAEIVIPPIERIIVDEAPLIQNYSGDVQPVQSWGRQIVFPDGLYKKVIDECGNYRVVVCIVDSGVDSKHKNLRGGHWLLPSNYSGDQQKHWHGTHVAGIVWQMVAGIAQNKGNVKMKDVQILRSSGSGSFAAAANMANTETQLFEDELKQGVGVILNNSWGHNGGTVSVFEQALSKSAAKGVIWIASSGNSGVSGPGYPGTSEHTVSIASLQQAGLKRSPFSTMNDKVDIAMPGSLINSTLPDDRQGKASGTSMAAPFLSGWAALAYGKYGPVLTGANMAKYARYCATDLPPDKRDDATGWGIAYVSKMLNTDPCDVPGIDCDGEEEPEEPEEEPEEPDNPGVQSNVSFEGNDYIIRWNRQGEQGFNILLVNSVTVSGSAAGDSKQAYDELKQFVDSYANNRAIVLTAQMGYTDAAWWYGQFMEYVAKQKGIDLQVDQVRAQDEQGRRTIATGFDRAAQNATGVRIESVDSDTQVDSEAPKQGRFLIRALWAVKNEVGSRATPTTEFEDYAGMYLTFAVSEGKRPTREEISKRPPFRGAILKEVLSIIKR